MKQLFLLAGAILLQTSLFAQKDIPSYGNIDKADLEMKECPIDKEAAAMKLVDDGKLSFTWNNRDFFRMTKERRIRIKILKDKGISNADIRIRYVSDDRYERISEISGYSYNLGPGGEIEKTKLEKSQIFDQKVTERYSEVRFTFPAVKVGSIIEYRYTVTKESFRYIEPWLFQTDIPTRASRFVAEIPEFFKFTTSVNTYSVPEKKEEEFSDKIFTSNGSVSMNVTRSSYVLRNVAALKDEPFMSGYKDYIQRIEFQLSALVIGTNYNSFTTTWEELARELREAPYFGEQLRKNVSMQVLDQQVKAAATPYTKMLLIHNYFKKNFHWDGHTDYGCFNVKKIAESGTGSTGDINLLLINKLRDAGLEAWPALASTRDNGRVNTLYPFLNQFNMVLAMVAIDGKNYFLNGADPFNAAKLIPYDVMTSSVLVVKKDNAEWLTLWDEKMVDKHRVAIIGNINGQGVMEGEAFASSFDYAKNPRVKAIKDDKEKYTASYLKHPEADIKVDKLDVENLENDSLPLEQKIKYTYKLNSSGEYAYFTLNMFTGLEKNPFLAETRTTDIDFGYNRTYAVTGHITIPDNYAFEELPKVPGIIMPDTSIVFMRHIFKEENTLSYKLTLEFRRPTYYASEYEDFREFYKQLFAMLNEQIVLKKIK
jgi:hypothetical protein